MREYMHPSLFELLPEPLKFALYGVIFAGMFLIVVKAVAWEYRKQRHISVEVLKAYLVLAAPVMMLAAILMVYGPLAVAVNVANNADENVKNLSSWAQKEIERTKLMAEVGMRLLPEDEPTHNQ